jgi:hypothetical protein
MTLLVFAAPGAAHTRLGGYQDMANSLPGNWHTPYPLVRGTPMVDYGTFRARNPVTTAQYGLASWSLWLHYRDRSRLGDAMRAARWLAAISAVTAPGTTASAIACPGPTRIWRP